MRRRQTLRRLLLLMLFVAFGLLLFRLVAGPPQPAGLVVWTELDAGALRHAAFEVGTLARFAVEATGSFEQAEGTPALAAYPWIVRRSDRTVVWRMSADDAQRDRGTLALRRDTFELDAGTYDVYFAAYGNDARSRQAPGFFDRLLGGEARWQGDASKWRVVLQALDGAPARALDGQPPAPAALGDERLVWSSAPMRSRREAFFLFEVKKQAPFTLYAVGEIDRAAKDYGWIEDALTGEQRWVMDAQNTQPAAGAPYNRLFRDAVTLPPGVYRVGFKTDRSHAYRDWDRNPPFDPAAWGLSLFARDSAAVVAFDPWNARTPLVSFLRVPSSTEREAEIEVMRPVRLVVSAQGEISGSGSLYDYAQLERIDGEEVWKMSRERSEAAGGNDKNRREVAFVTLEPGRYLLRYETDDSHAFDDWNTDPPDNPARWGVALFPLAPADSAAVRVVRQSGAPGVAPPPPPPLPDLAGGTVLVEGMRLGNDVRFEQPFTVPAAGRVAVVALGEISRGGRYDYGWIAEARTGRVVWEMTYDNTKPAGGSDRNRRFEGFVRLAPGDYVAHFKTDDSHAYDAFGVEAPDSPAAWGLRVLWMEGASNPAPSPPDV